MKKVISLLLAVVILSSISYTASVSIYNGGLRTVKTVNKSAVSDSLLILGRNITPISELIIQSSIDSPPTEFAITGYTYKSTVTVVNDCDTSQHTRFIIDDFPAAVLADGGYIQLDGDDITLTGKGR